MQTPTPSQTELRKRLVDFLETHPLSGGVSASQQIESALRAYPLATVADIVMKEWINNRDQMILAHWLIEQGVNFLDRDQANITHFFRQDNELATLSFAISIQEDRGTHVLRAPNGGNLLHVLADAQPEWLGRALIDHNNRKSGEQGRYRDHWFNEARGSDGKNPLHVWWEGCLATPTHIRQKHTNFAFFACDVSEALIAGGADIEARDHTGASSADLIVKASSSGFALLEALPVLERSIRIVEARTLQSSTAQVAHSRASPRL